MISLFVSFFLLGLSFGAGPCVAGCGPLLISYLAGTRKNVAKSVAYYLLFSLARVTVYLALGAAVFMAGKFIAEGILAAAAKYIFIAGGIFIIVLGILMVIGKKQGGSFCSFLHRKFLHHDKKSVLILGLVTGISPCAPLLAMFSYAALISKNWTEPLFYALAFGVGTTVSPLLLLAVFAGFIPAVGKGWQGALNRIFAIICGVIIIILGMRLLARSI